MAQASYSRAPGSTAPIIEAMATRRPQRRTRRAPQARRRPNRTISPRANRARRAACGGPIGQEEQLCWPPIGQEEQHVVAHRSVEQTGTACGGPVRQGSVCCVHRAGRTAGGGSVDTKNNMCPLGKKNSVWWVRACPMGGQQSCSSCPMGPPHAALLPIPRVRWTPARAVLLA